MTGEKSSLMHLSLVKSDTSLDEIDELLNKCVIKEYFGENRNFDILQEAIISGNTDAVSYLLMKNCPSLDYHPPCNEYLHLACKLRNPAMIQTILAARSGDFHIKGRVCYPNPCFHHDEIFQSNSKQTFLIGQTALDIVVANKDLKCLLVMLNGVPDLKKASPASLLCKINHPAALAMLVKVGLTADDFENAYHLCLQYRRHFCLNVLLSETNMSQQLHVGKMNPFHFMYMYSSGYNNHTSRHDGLLETTQILLKAGCKASSFLPICSYPLYSLLFLIFEDVRAYGEEYVSDGIASQQLLSCLKLILKQDGVKLNLNEVKIGAEVTGEVMYGRNPFRSAFDVVSHCAYKDLMDVNLASSEMIRDTVDILLTYKTEDCQLEATDLSGILKLMGRGKRSRSIQKNLEHVVFRYLWHGVDTNTPTVKWCSDRAEHLYPINHYIMSMYEARNRGDQIMLQTLSENPVLKWIVYCMDYNTLCKASKITAEFLSKEVEELFTPALKRFLLNPPLLRLKTLAAKVVWKQIDRQYQSLQQLPIPNSMKSQFINIVIKGI